MKKESLSGLKKENTRLKTKIKQLEKIVGSQKSIITEYETNWHLKLFNDLEIILQQYTLLTDPPPVKIKTSFKNHAAHYEVKPANIIGIYSKGRTKQILLDVAIANSGSSKSQTNILYTESNLEELQKLIDPGDFLFSLPKRGIFTNVKYHNLEDNLLITDTITIPSLMKFGNIKVDSKIADEFIKKKKAYEHISSLQKNQLRDILNAINKSITNFEK
ncbi:MAG: hypothetical protein JSS98_13175 [Bacteroidetes bacterium]|nr:hypothetical protein [Bacteroidota bacterium]